MSVQCSTTDPLIIYHGSVNKYNTRLTDSVITF